MPSGDRRLEARRKPTQVRAELTRQRILKAAAHVFAELGYAAGTTNRIAAEARISIGSLYQYFPNKDAILAELLIQHIDRGVWAGAADVDLTPGTLEEMVRALVRDAIEAHSGDPQLLALMVEQAPMSQTLRDKIEEHGRLRTTQIREVLAAHPDVRVGSPDIAADLILFTVEINTHKFMAAQSEVMVDDFERELVAMVTRYLRGD